MKFAIPFFAIIIILIVLFIPKNFFEKNEQVSSLIKNSTTHVKSIHKDLIYELSADFLTVSHKNTTDEFYDMPQSLKFPEQDFLKNCKKCYAAQKVYPIGWSLKGHFAYMSETPPLKTGCYYNTFVILQTQTNKKIFTKSYDSCEARQKDPDGDVALDLEDLWLAQSDFFQQHLKKYNILKQDPLSLQEFPILYKDGILKAKLEFKTEKTEDILKIREAALELEHWWFQKVKDVEPGLKKKKAVYYWSYDEFDVTMFLHIAGYIKSPYDEKIVIFVNEITQEWDGPPHSVNRVLIGLDLGQVVSF